MAKNSKKIDSSTGGYLPLVIPIAFGAVAIIAAGRIFLPLAIATGLGWAVKYYLQLQQKKFAQINTVFYKLIQENQGRITTLDLAMKANVSGGDAQAYLDRRSKEFCAQFDVTEQGGMVYYFETALSPVSTELPQPAQSQPPLSKTSFPAPKTQPVETQLNLSNFTQPSLLEHQNLPAFPAPLSQAELARRFNVHANTVSKWKSKPEFPEWSRDKDPAGIAWKYEPDRKRFCPLN